MTTFAAYFIFVAAVSTVAVPFVRYYTFDDINP